MAEESPKAKRSLAVQLVRLLGLGLGMALGIMAAKEFGGESVEMRVLVGGGVAGGFVLLWAWLCLLFFRNGSDE